jgi:hypothetical protein
MAKRAYKPHLRMKGAATMYVYEKCFKTLKEAKQYQKAVKAGKITSFLSLDENGEVITIYCLRWKALF